MRNSGATVVAFGEKTPHIHPSVFIADGARIVGDVQIGEQSSVWYNAVIRGDFNWVRIGGGVNVQDGSVLHVTHDTAPLEIGSDVTIGHGAIVHGCTIDGQCLIGMGSIILDGAVIQTQTLLAAGSVVREGTVIPQGVLAAGNPAIARRDLTPEEKIGIISSSKRYAAYAQTHLLTYQER